MNYGTDVKASVVSVEIKNGFFKYKLLYRGRIYSDIQKEKIKEIEIGNTVICSRGYTLEGSMKLKIRRKYEIL